MTEIEHSPNRLPWPPILYLAAIAVGIILGFLAPLPWIGQPLSDILFAIGWLMVAAAVFIEVQAIRTMSKAKTTIRPNRGSEHLVTGGPFSLSRNPIYLANTMIVIGVAFISGIAWFIPLGLLAAYATQKLAIEREEQHLAARFGKKYRDYAKRVRRWI